MLSGNIFDYIDWRGDLTFEQSPVNEVDGLILSLISYVDFSDIVPEGMQEEISIYDAAEKYFEIRDIEKEKQNLSMMRNAPDIIRKLAGSERYKNLKLANYVERLNSEIQEQFAAVSIILDKKTIFISYRGTDDNIVGWKEDFNMSFLESIPAQKDALKYLEALAEVWHGKIYLGGHSKGGNLAVYATVNSKATVKRRIIRIYNNDGPGFSEKVINSQRFKSVSDRIHTVVPHSSVVGMLFNHNDNFNVVCSSEAAPFQHDATTWKITGTMFERMDGLSDLGIIIDKTVSGWLDSLDDATRMNTVEMMFKVLEKAGVNTLKDLPGKKNMKNLHALLKSYNSLNSDAKKEIAKVIKELIKTTKEVTRQTLMPNLPRLRAAQENQNQSVQ